MSPLRREILSQALDDSTPLLDLPCFRPSNHRTLYDSVTNLSRVGQCPCESSPAGEILSKRFVMESQDAINDEVQWLSHHNDNGSIRRKPDVRRNMDREGRSIYMRTARMLCHRHRTAICPNVAPSRYSSPDSPGLNE